MTNALRTLRTCRSCNEERHHQGRGLCATCYDRARRAGTLDQYPPLRPGGTGRPTPRRKHGHFTLAIKQRCQCDPCRGYYRTYYDRENVRTVARRRAQGVKETPTVSAAARARQRLPVLPLELGNPNRADEVVIEQLLAGKPADARHPDDRAAVLAAYQSGRITKNRALKAMHCSTAQLDATLAQLENA